MTRKKPPSTRILVQCEIGPPRGPRPHSNFPWFRSGTPASFWHASCLDRNWAIAWAAPNLARDLPCHGRPASRGAGRLAAWRGMAGRGPPSRRGWTPLDARHVAGRSTGILAPAGRPDGVTSHARGHAAPLDVGAAGRERPAIAGRRRLPARGRWTARRGDWTPRGPFAHMRRRSRAHTRRRGPAGRRHARTPRAGDRWTRPAISLPSLDGSPRRSIAAGPAGKPAASRRRGEARARSHAASSWTCGAPCPRIAGHAKTPSLLHVNHGRSAGRMRPRRGCVRVWARATAPTVASLNARHGVDPRAGPDIARRARSPRSAHPRKPRRRPWSRSPVGPGAHAHARSRVPFIPRGHTYFYVAETCDM